MESYESSKLNIDPSLFSAPITPEERADFKARFYPLYSPTRAMVISALVAVAGLVALMLSIGMGSEGNTVFSVVAVGALIIGLGQFFNRLEKAVTFNMRLGTSIKAYRFATANTLNYEAHVENPVRNGFIFQNPGAKNTEMFDLISSTGEQPFEIGSYMYETGSGRRTMKWFYTYMRIGLNKNLPHMVLDTTADDTKFFGITQSNLGMSFTKDQAMRLEGNFNDYFTLYAPKEYKTDALYVFTPDLMARMIDDVSSFNAEIVDDSLYIYSTNASRLDEPATFQKFFSIFDSVGPKAYRQTDNYRDTRSAVVGEVAEGGRRLKGRVTVALSWVAGLAALYYFAPVLWQSIENILSKLN